MKRILAVASALAFSGALFAGPVAADPPSAPTGGCPAGDGWRLEYFPSDTKTDRNGDGYVCHKDTVGRGNDPVGDGTTYNHKDNNNPIFVV